MSYACILIGFVELFFPYALETKYQCQYKNLFVASHAFN